MRYVCQLLKGYGLWAEDAVEEESLPGTILSEEKAFLQGVADHEVCAGARKLRRAAEVFADQKVENKVSDDKKWRRLMRRWRRRLSLIPRSRTGQPES